MVYRRKGRDAWFVAVPTRTGRVKRTTGTPHKPTAKRIEEMLIVLGPNGERAWDLLDPRPVSGSTKRKYLAAVKSFAIYVVDMGVLRSNPARDVKAPPAADPRVVELELSDVKRIMDRAETPFRALFAPLYGAGVEISAALSFGNQMSARTVAKCAHVERRRGPAIHKYASPIGPGHQRAMTDIGGRKSPLSRTPPTMPSRREKHKNSAKWVPLWVPHLRNDMSQAR